MFRGLQRIKSVKVLPKDRIAKWKIFTGDLVEIIDGKDKGKRGQVKKVDRKKNRLWVEGANFVKKTMRSTEQTQGGIFLMEAPVHYSNVALVDPLSKSPTRVRTKWLETGEKVRTAAKSGAVIEKPKPDFKLIRAAFDPRTDTPIDVVMKKTYVPPE